MAAERDTLRQQGRSELHPLFIDNPGSSSGTHRDAALVKTFRTEAKVLTMFCQGSSYALLRHTGAPDDRQRMPFRSGARRR